MDEITLTDVEKLANLARLGINDEEKASLAKQMTEILTYVKQLDAINTDNVEPTSQVTGLVNVYADDEVVVSEITRDELLSNAPQQEKGFIKVKSVLDDKGDE